MQVACEQAEASADAAVAFQNELARAGLAVVRMPAESIACMQEAVERIYLSNADGIQPHSVELGQFARAKPICNSFPAMMEWHWAKNDDALHIFQPAAQAIGAMLGPQFDLIAAKFIVAPAGECPEDDAKFHQDFGPESVPRFAAVTALIPLCPLKFPEAEGNLEWWPWDEAAVEARVRWQKDQTSGPPPQPNVHPYRVGEAAVLDGKCLHRTQPFSAEAFSSTTSHPRGVLSGMRILASLYFAQLPEEADWEEAVWGVLSSQGAPLTKTQEQRREFVIRVDRSSGTPLGVIIEQSGVEFVIKEVNEGVISIWNSDNSSTVIPGDRLVAVNGRRGDAKALIAELKELKVLQITVARRERNIIDV